MDRAIFYMLQAIYLEMQSQRPGLGEAERQAIYAEAGACVGAALLANNVWNMRLEWNADGSIKTPPPASE